MFLFAVYFSVTNESTEGFSFDPLCKNFTSPQMISHNCPDGFLWLADKETSKHLSLQRSILAVVRSSETTTKSYGRVSKITHSSGGRVNFKE